MLYWLFFEKLFRYYSPFRVFQYSTFRTGMATLTAMLISLALGPWLITRLRQFQILRLLGLLRREAVARRIELALQAVYGGLRGANAVYLG